jgi:hypothetical protein
MAQDNRSQNPSAEGVASQQEIDPAQYGAPHDIHEQTVAERDVNQVQRIRYHEARLNNHALSSREKERDPQDVGKRAGKNEGPQGHFGRDPFGRQTGCEMSDEHAGIIRVLG